MTVQLTRAVDRRREHASSIWLRVGGTPALETSVLKESARSGVYRVTFAGGTAILKWGVRDAMRREYALYADVLRRLDLPAARCWGLVSAGDGAHSWLALEDVGDDAFSQDRDDHRRAAGRWLATLHTRAAAELKDLELSDVSMTAHLERLRRTRTQLKLLGGDVRGEERAVLARCAELLDRTETEWPRLSSSASRFPPTLVHGDFTAKTVRVRNRHGDLEVVPLDWGSAGIGTPAPDLVRVDGDAYRALSPAAWGLRSAAVFEEVRSVGVVLRLLAGIHWAVIRVERAVDRVDKGFDQLDLYATWLEDATTPRGLSSPTGRPEHP
jgi:aminoglycoside phosphotransferase (APT) family kinase protein